MKLDFNIDVHHLTRVEGHGNIKIKVEDGKLRACQWEIVETPRFIEALVKGKKYDVVAPIAARICGICSVGHSLASIRATERAMGIPVSEQTGTMRLLLKHGETIQSHVLHLYFLVAPDLYMENSVIPLLESRPRMVVLAANLKKLGNDICALLGGRHFHPQSVVPGGFLKVPKKGELQQLKERLVTAIKDLTRSVEVFLAQKPSDFAPESKRFSYIQAQGHLFPDFVRETEFVSLKGEGEYPFIGGKLISSDGVIKGESDYRAMTNEYTVAYSTAKWAKLSRKSYAVGALARFNNNYQFLSPLARKLASRLNLHPVNHNPFMNNYAQLVECIHCFEDSLRLIDELLEMPLKIEKIEFDVKAGIGAGAVEVPRGILYHEYEYDKEGRVVKANCIIPTNQNHGNIQHDLEDLAEVFHGRGWEPREIERLAEMLVRAYDPCISCSVH